MLDKELMAEIAVLYYEKGLTQQEIAKRLFLSRQTVSKLLNDAREMNIVEITVHHPQKECENLQKQLRAEYGIKQAVIKSSVSKNDDIRQMMTIKSAIDYLLPLINEGNKNIALSWGRTIKALISELPSVKTTNNVVYPLFGATDHEEACFSSNEIARSFADKIGAKAKYAWFPYLPDDLSDGELFKKTTHYAKLSNLWDNIDIAIVGVGNSQIIDLFESTFGHSEEHSEAVGDLATHFFNKKGEILQLYRNTLCAKLESLKKAGLVVAVACGDNKITAIQGALKSKLIDVLITDEHTARALLK